MTKELECAKESLWQDLVQITTLLPRFSKQDIMYANVACNYITKALMELDKIKNEQQ